MKFDKENLKKLINEMNLLDNIELVEIPDINLYMDQLTTFIDNKLGHLKRGDDDKILTKTMINNYTKSGILMPPVNKKYSKKHMILLILIYYLKQILSISDIQAIMKPILNNVSNTDDDILPIEEIYSTLMEIKNNELKNYIDTFDEKSEIIKEKTKNLEGQNKDTAELFLSVLILVAQADAQKRLAERIIDEYFKKLE